MNKLLKFLFTRKVCDNCGKVNPPTFKNSKATTCCSSSDEYVGKTYKESFQFPLKWVGFWK